MDYVVNTATLTDNISAAANAAAAAMQKAADAADNLTASVTKVGPTATALVNRFDDSTKATNNYTKATTTLAQAQQTLAIAVTEGRITQDQANGTLATLQQRVAVARDAMAATTPAVTALTGANVAVAAAATGAATAHAGFYREIVVLGHEMLVGNYSRIPGSIAVLAERSGNLNGIFHTLGSLVLGWPGLFAAGAAALGVMGYAAESQQRQLLGLQAALMATRDDYAAMAAEATAAARAVAGSSGFSSADSLAAAKDIAAVPTFTGSQAQLQALIRTAGDLARVLGVTLPAAAETLAKAMQDPAAEADALAKSHFPGLTQALVDSITAMANSGDKAGAFGLILDDMKGHIGGAATATKTDLQRALDDLGDAFKQTGADGKTFGQTIGDAVRGAAAAAVEAVARIVGAVAAARSDLAAGSLPGGPANTFNPAAPIPVGTPTPTLGPPVTHTVNGQQVTEQAVGLYQVLPSTGASVGASPAALATTTGNIQAAISVLLQYYLQSGGDINATLARYGGYGTNTSAAAGYIASVTGANPSSLDAGTLSAIQQASNSRGLPAQLEQLLEKLPVVESSGRQFSINDAVTVGGTPVFAGNQPSPNDVAGGAIFGGAGPNGLANTPTSIVDQALAAADKAGTPQAAGSSAFASIQLYQSALAALAAQGDTTSDSVTKLQQALQKAQVEFSNAIGPAQVLLRELTSQASGADQVAAAWANGAGAADHATNVVKAQTQAIQYAAPGTQQYADIVTALSAAYDKVTAAQQRGQANQQIYQQGLDLQYLQAEAATLGESADARARDLATLKEQQTIDKTLPDIEAAQKQKLLDNAAAIADGTTKLQEQQQVLNDLSGAFTSAFDTVGNAIAQAFVQGEGAAVNWKNVMASVIEQVVQEILKLAILNPILNSLFGQNQTTLGGVLTLFGGASSAAGGASGASGGSGIFGVLSDLSSVIGLSGQTGLLSALGITGSGGLLDTIGLTGANGILSGVGSGIGGILSTGTGIGADASGTAILDGLGIDAGVGAGGVSLGPILGGVGIGTAAGSLVGGALQKSLNKQGQGPLVGSLLGSVAGSLLGAVVAGWYGAIAGGLIGGIFGGAGGSLIGPPKSNPYSFTDLGLKDGMLTLGASAAQLADSNQGTTNSDKNTINDDLKTLGIKISKINLPANTIFAVGVDPDRSSGQPKLAGTDLADVFPEFRFQSSNNDPVLDKYLNGKSYATLQDMTTDVGTYVNLVNTTIPALTKSADVTGTLTDAIAALNGAFDPAIVLAKQYGVATDALTASQTAALKAVNDAATAQVANLDEGFTSRYMTAAATVSGNPADAEAQSLYVFDLNEQPQRDALSSALETIYGTAYKTSTGYADQMAQLEATLGEERLAIQQQYTDKLVATADQTITSLGSFARSLEFGTGSPLTATQQYALAGSLFHSDVTGAASGDFNSLSDLQNSATTFLSASSNVNGSGAQYVSDFKAVLDALQSAASLTPDTLTASVLQSETRTQTQQLQDSLADLKAAVNQVNATLQQNGLAPARVTT